MEPLKYRLMLVQATEDDPLTNAYMLQKLKEKYDELDVKMSDKMKQYIKKRTEAIKESLGKELKEKKEKYNELTKSQEKEDKENKDTDDDRIFTEEDIKRFLQKH